MIATFFVTEKGGAEKSSAPMGTRTHRVCGGEGGVTFRRQSKKSFHGKISLATQVAPCAQKNVVNSSAVNRPATSVRSGSGLYSCELFSDVLSKPSQKTNVRVTLRISRMAIGSSSYVR